MSYQPPPPSDPHFYGPHVPQSPPPPPPHFPPPPMHMHTTTGTDSSRKFLNLSAGALIAVITGIIVVCCVLPIVLCFATPFLSAITDGLEEPGKVTVSKCSFDGVDVGSTAKIEYTVENPGSVSASYTIKFVVRDAAGSVVGEATDWAFSVEGGRRSSDIVTVFLTGAGPKTCEVLSVE